jgi:DNA (cytosine-5)-methyltransferase 1
MIAGYDAEAENGISAGFNGYRSVSGSIEYAEERSPCLNATMPPNVLTAVDQEDNVAGTLKADERSAVASIDCRNLRENGDISGTLQAKSSGGYSLNYQNPVRIRYLVRRLTPTECERLMALPDDWTEYGCDGNKILRMSDSARYQMCGNSIVVNVLAYFMQNIVEALKGGNDGVLYIDGGKSAA